MIATVDFFILVYLLSVCLGLIYLPERFSNEYTQIYYAKKDVEDSFIFQSLAFSAYQAFFSGVTIDYHMYEVFPYSELLICKDT
jgi:hypothetical protein